MPYIMPKSLDSCQAFRQKNDETASGRSTTDGYSINSRCCWKWSVCPAVDHFGFAVDDIDDRCRWKTLPIAYMR